MAFVVLKTGKGMSVKPEVAKRLQEVLDGSPATEQERAKAAKIRKIYFSREYYKREAHQAQATLFNG